MKLRHIILFGLMVISPLLLAARNEIGAEGGGCGCPWFNPASEGGTEAIIKPEIKPGETTIAKSILDNIPDMDLIVITKVDPILKSKLLTDLSYISKENSSLDGLVTLMKKGKLFPKGSEGASKGIAKVEGAISANDKNLIIIGMSFDWSPMDFNVIFNKDKDQKEDKDTAPKIKDLFGMVYAKDPKVSKEIADLLEDVIEQKKDSKDVEVGDKKLSAHKGPEICKGKDDKKECKNLAMYIHDMGDGTAIIGNEDVVKDFYNSSTNSGKAGGLKNSTAGIVLQNISSTETDADVLAAISTPLMGKLKKYYNSENISAEEKAMLPLFWLGEELPSYSACGLSMKVSGDMRLTANCYLLDLTEYDFRATIEIKEKLGNLINWASLKMIKFSDDYGETCRGKAPVDCKIITDENTCKSSYTASQSGFNGEGLNIKRNFQSGKDLGTFRQIKTSQETRHCYWDEDEGKCYMYGSYGEDNGRCHAEATEIEEEGAGTGSFNIGFSSSGWVAGSDETISVPVKVERNNFQGDIEFSVVSIDGISSVTTAFNPIKCSSTCSGNSAVMMNITIPEMVIGPDTPNPLRVKIRGTSGDMVSDSGELTINLIEQGITVNLVDTDIENGWVNTHPGDTITLTTRVIIGNAAIKNVNLDAILGTALIGPPILDASIPFDNGQIIDFRDMTLDIPSDILAEGEDSYQFSITIKGTTDAGISNEDTVEVRVLPAPAP